MIELYDRPMEMTCALTFPVSIAHPWENHAIRRGDRETISNVLNRWGDKNAIDGFSSIRKLGARIASVEISNGYFDISLSWEVDNE